MKATICKQDYDTETATLIQKYTKGFYGDPAGYEEILFQNQEGCYFLYLYGGIDSPYPTEKIKRLGKVKVTQWLEEHKI